MVLFIASRGNTFVRGTCALPSGLLVSSASSVLFWLTHTCQLIFLPHHSYHPLSTLLRINCDVCCRRSNSSVINKLMKITLVNNMPCITFTVHYSHPPILHHRSFTPGWKRTSATNPSHHSLLVASRLPSQTIYWIRLISSSTTTSATTCQLQGCRPVFPVLDWSGTWLPGWGLSAHRRCRRSPTSISRHSDLCHAPHVQHLRRPMPVHDYGTCCQSI